jgi:hypothetical protein
MRYHIFLFVKYLCWTEGIKPDSHNTTLDGLLQKIKSYSSKENIHFLTMYCFASLCIRTEIFLLSEGCGKAC